MATNRAVIVSFVTKLNSKGLQQAQKQMSSLGKTALQAGMRTKLGFLLSGTAATYFAQQQMSLALKAVEDEDRALRSLEQTLKNVGSAFSLSQVDAFVDSLQRAFGVSEDVLRPALQQLITTTGDVATSQELLKIAIDTSKGSGKDLATVTAALSRAYSGNISALGRLNVGLDKSKLKAGDLDGAILELSNKFSGQAAAAAESFSGQMDKLRISSEKARENLGMGLIEALKVLSGDQKGGLNKVGGQLENLGTRFGNVAIGLASFVNKLKPILKPLALIGLLLTPIGKVLVGLDFIFGKLEKSGEKIRKQREALAATMATESKRDMAAAGRVNIESKSNKLSKEQLALQKKLRDQENKLNAEKEKERAKKAEEARQDKIKSDLAAKFDIDNIQLVAAKRNAIEDGANAETLARISALQALRTEGYKDDEAALNKLIELDKMRAKFVESETERLNRLKVEIPVSYVTKTGVEIPNPGMGGGGSPFPRVAPGRATDFGLPAPIPLTPMFMEETFNAAVGQGVTVYVDVQGNIFTEQELTAAIATGLYELQRGGTNPNLALLGRG
jgi:hypothetical protein